MGLTAHQPPAETNGEESIGKIQPPRKPMQKCTGARKTLQQAPLNK